jgi:putative metallohydrolase (TIGR04338 family)
VVPRLLSEQVSGQYAPHGEVVRRSGKRAWLRFSGNLAVLQPGKRKNKMIDSQKTKAIAALEALVVQQRRFADFEDAQQYLDDKIRLRWFSKRWPRISELGIIVKPLETSSSMEPGNWEKTSSTRKKFKTTMFPVLIVPAWKLDEVTLWHLAAHAIAGEQHERNWAKTLLLLVRHAMGKPVEKLLRAKFIEQGVKYKTRPNLSEEVRRKMSERALNSKLGRKMKEPTEMEYGGGGA